MPFGRFFPNSPKREPNPAAKIITFNHVLLINRVYDFFELIFVKLHVIIQNNSLSHLVV